MSSRPSQPDPGASDEQLLERVAASDREAFAMFYDRHASRVLGLVLRILGNRTEAEDVLQETFFQVWSRREAFDPHRGSPLAWICLLGRSRAIDRIRRRPKETSTADLTDRDDAAPPVPERLEREESASRTGAAVARLPEDQRSAIELSFFHGLPHGEIARKLEIPLGTVKTRIRLGMERLRQMLGSHEGGIVR